MTSTGSRVVTFSLATSETWKDKNSGERKERTAWHDVVVFNEPLGKIAEAHLRKGSQVYLEGAIEKRKWTDQSGSERWALEIVLRPFRGALVLIDKTERDAPDPDEYGVTKERAAPSGARADDVDDDIPF